MESYGKEMEQRATEEREVEQRDKSLTLAPSI
jgi:hypothetical protein